MTQNLSQREVDILLEVVTAYLESGEPVASGSIARLSATGLSSPSIRNVMAELEEKGYLYQPHTSSGRVPTDLGLRVFVDHLLLSNVNLPAREQRRLRALLAPAGPLEEVLEHASRALARLTPEVGLAVAPAQQRLTLRSIHFVQVAAGRVLAVLVTQGGLVESRLLTTEREYRQTELDRISNYCTDTFTGLSIAEIRARLLGIMAEERARADELLRGVVELTRRAVGEHDRAGEVFIQGSERLLTDSRPEQLDAVRQLFAAFADKALLVTLLTKYIEVPGPSVVVGSELALGAGGELGLIVSSFQLASGERGLVGVIGRRRMDYPRIIPIVDFMGHYLGGGGERDAD